MSGTVWILHELPLKETSSEEKRALSCCWKRTHTPSPLRIYTARTGIRGPRGEDFTPVPTTVGTEDREEKTSLQCLLQLEQRSKRTGNFTLVSTWSQGPGNLDFGPLHFRQLREWVKGSSDHLLSRKPSSIDQGLADPSWPHPLSTRF